MAFCERGNIEALMWKVNGQWREVQLHQPPDCTAVTIEIACNEAVSINYRCWANETEKGEKGE